MNSKKTEPREISIPARDDYPLAATLFGSRERPSRVVVISSATAVPQRFYRHYAAATADAGFTVITYDYRGVARSEPKRLKGFQATARDWALNDLPGVVDWAADELGAEKLLLVGHSFGGQVAGMYDRPGVVDGMLTISAQSGHWRLQGGEQKLVVWLHTHLTLPLLTKLMGYMPMRAVGAGEDIPAGVALEWARWCRHRDYILGDSTLPLERYRDFTAPVLAYSIADDKWGTPKSVDAMMGAYPNVERRHVDPAEAGQRSIGHLGFFRPKSEALWADTHAWFDRC